MTQLKIRGSTQILDNSIPAIKLVDGDRFVLMSFATVSGTTQTAVANTHYSLTNVAATTVTLPASPSAGNTVKITPLNGLLTNVVARNGNNIMGLAEDMTLNINETFTFTFFTTYGWRLE